MVYLDHAATTPVEPEVLQAMLPWFGEQYGNPSSVHQMGQEARAAVDAARMTISSFLSCNPTEVYFTASGTESCNWALLGVAERSLLKGKSAHMIVSSVEHSAVLETARFLEKAYGVSVDYLPVDQGGLVSIEELKAMFRPETVLVSVMMVNNEVGTVQPISELAAACKEQGVVFHTDACQASPYFDLDVEKLGVDLLTMNASKLYGPKGVGLLYIRDGVDISAWTFGGGQEFKMRAGTENVPAIVGFGKAVEIRSQLEDVGAHERELRDQLWEKLQKSIPGVELNGNWDKRSPNNVNIFLPGADAENLVKKLDLEGFAVSMGSACSSGTIEPSHVNRALGYDEQRARSSLRISLGRGNTNEEVESFTSKLTELA